MRATITRYIEALKKRRASDEGFSLIELIVVVAILGILVAIAIPVFSNIQKSAKDNSLASAAANGAQVVAAQIASGIVAQADLTTELDKSESADYTLAVTLGSADELLTDFCVTASPVANGALDGGTPQQSGPATGCSGPVVTP